MNGSCSWKRTVSLSNSDRSIRGKYQPVWFWTHAQMTWAVPCVPDFGSCAGLVIREKSIGGKMPPTRHILCRSAVRNLEGKIRYIPRRRLGPLYGRETVPLVVLCKSHKNEEIIITIVLPRNRLQVPAGRNPVYGIIIGIRSGYGGGRFAVFSDKKKKSFIYFFFFYSTRIIVSWRAVDRRAATSRRRPQQPVRIHTAVSPSCCAWKHRRRKLHWWCCADNVWSVNDI